MKTNLVAGFDSMLLVAIDEEDIGVVAKKVRGLFRCIDVYRDNFSAANTDFTADSSSSVHRIFNSNTTAGKIPSVDGHNPVDLYGASRFEISHDVNAGERWCHNLTCHFQLDSGRAVDSQSQWETQQRRHDITDVQKRQWFGEIYFFLLNGTKKHIQRTFSDIHLRNVIGFEVLRMHFVSEDAHV